jgi:hypothetical protein
MGRRALILGLGCCCHRGQPQGLHKVLKARDMGHTRLLQEQQLWSGAPAASPSSAHDRTSGSSSSAAAVAAAAAAATAEALQLRGTIISVAVTEQKRRLQKRRFPRSTIGSVAQRRRAQLRLGVLNTVADLKLLFQRAQAVPVTLQKALLGGREMQDWQTLQEAGVANGTQVSVVLRGRHSCDPAVYACGASNGVGD